MRHKKKKGFSKSFYTKVYILLGVALILFSLYSAFQINSYYNLIGKKLDEAKEEARPADIELITITASSCADCFDISTITDKVKSYNVNVIKEETLDYLSEEASSLIKKYRVEKVPTVLVTGELEKASIRDLEEKGDALVFTKLTPPYIITESNQVAGRVTATILEDPSCDKCTDLTETLEGIKKLGVKIVEEMVIGKNSKEGQDLVSKYKIEKLPTLIFSKDFELYDAEIVDSWSQIGSISDDGSYILEEINPPYLDLATNKVVGLVSMTVLTDNACTECYDPDKFHKPILQRIGVFLDEEKKIDISETGGKSLIEKYSITKVPTILLEGDVEEYPILVKAWEPVGSKEDDGVYVFRMVEASGKLYKDLDTNEVVNPAE